MSEGMAQQQRPRGAAVQAEIDLCPAAGKIRAVPQLLLLALLLPLHSRFLTAGLQTRSWKAAEFTALWVFSLLIILGYSCST